MTLVTKIPRWLLRQLVMPGGARFEKRKPLELRASLSPRLMARVRCAVCSEITYSGDRTVHNGICYHQICFAAWDADRKRRLQPLGTVDNPFGAIIPATVMSKADVPPGNLGQSLYRYWVGSRMSGVDYALCRVCRTPVQSSDRMTFHKLETKFRVAGHSCQQLIDKVIPLLVARHQCVICRATTDCTRFGFPICSDGCEINWRFNQNDHLALKVAIANLRAGLLQAENQTNGFERENGAPTL